MAPKKVFLMLGYTEAALVLVLSSTSGEILDKQIVRTFAKERHCVQFYFDPKYQEPLKQHGFDYWFKNKQYAEPGYQISFRCQSIGPYYTA